MTFTALPVPRPVGTRYILCGPTRNLPDGYALVRCAAEIPVRDYPVAHDFATKDFTPFDDSKIIDQLPALLYDIDKGRRLYVGCMGGVGRTGTLLSIIVAQHPFFSAMAAVEYIRANHDHRAVETPQQFDQVLRHAHQYQALVPSPVTQAAPRLHLRAPAPSRKKGLWAMLTGRDQ